MAIIATNPVTTPAVPSTTFNEWFMTTLFGKFSPTSAPCNVELTHSMTVNGSSVLMPKSPTSSVSFNCDLWKESAADANIAALANTAESALLALVTAIATKRNLL